MDRFLHIFSSSCIRFFSLRIFTTSFCKDSSLPSILSVHRFLHIFSSSCIRFSIPSFRLEFSQPHSVSSCGALTNQDLIFTSCSSSSFCLFSMWGFISLIIIISGQKRRTVVYSLIFSLRIFTTSFCKDSSLPSFLSVHRFLHIFGVAIVGGAGNTVCLSRCS